MCFVCVCVCLRVRARVCSVRVGKLCCAYESNQGDSITRAVRISMCARLLVGVSGVLRLSSQ